MQKFVVSKISAFLQPLCATLALLTVPACSGPSDEVPAVEQNAGSVRLGIALRGEALGSLALNIRSQNLDPEVQRARVLDIPASGQVSASEYGLPAALYTIELNGQLLDKPDVTCSGSVSDVEVLAGQVTQVHGLVLTCTLDGGELEQLGGIDIEAEVELEEIPECGDLVQELSFGTLDPQVNEAVSIVAVVDEGVSVEWEASAGSFNESGAYVCPDIPGTYTVTATLTRDEHCEREISQQINCHSDYAGECAALPEQFAFTGTCGLRSPCHVTQDGCGWEVQCRGRTMAGEGVGHDAFPFIDDSGRECRGSVIGGVWQGTCVDDAGDYCNFSTDSTPDPVPYCEKLPAKISAVTTCGQSLAECDVIQDGCTFQARCDDATFATGGVTGSEIRWDTVVGDKNFRCTGPWDGSAVTGTCVERGRGIVDPETCDDFALTAIDDGSAGDCEETLPEDGFELAGCGLDGLCFASQNGCAWQVACGDKVYQGLADASNAYAFSVDGKACTGSVVDGKFVGQCASAAGVCDFAPVEPTVGEGCFQLPDAVTTGGCGAFWSCDVFTSGCNFQARCQNGQFSMSGALLENGIIFPGLAGYTCEAYTDGEESHLLGECTRENPDGSISQCRDLTETLGARLLIDWE